MATPHACAALVDVFPRLLRAKRHVVGTAPAAGAATLAVVLDHGPLRVSEVAEHLGLDLSTVSRQVAHLRQRDLLAASPDPADGRSQRLAVTDTGLAELRRNRRRLVDQLVADLTDWDDAEVEQLTRLLDRLARLGERPPARCGSVEASADHRTTTRATGPTTTEQRTA